MPAASAARPEPRALAERVAALARRLAERNRVLAEEVADLRAYIDRIQTQPNPAPPHQPGADSELAPPLEASDDAPYAGAAPAAAPAAAPPPPTVKVRDRESEKLLELVRIALDRTLQEVDDHLDRIQDRDDLAPEDLDDETDAHAR